MKLPSLTIYLNAMVIGVTWLEINQVLGQNVTKSDTNALENVFFLQLVSQFSVASKPLVPDICICFLRGQCC